MEAESKIDWQRKASVGTSKITTFLDPVNPAPSTSHIAECNDTHNGGDGARVETVTFERARGLVNHRPKTVTDITNAEEYRVHLRTEHTESKLTQLLPLSFATLPFSFAC